MAYFFRKSKSRTNGTNSGTNSGANETIGGATDGGGKNGGGTIGGGTICVISRPITSFIPKSADLNDHSGRGHIHSVGSRTQPGKSFDDMNGEQSSVNPLVTSSTTSNKPSMKKPPTTSTPLTVYGRMFKRSADEDSRDDEIVEDLKPDHVSASPDSPEDVTPVPSLLRYRTDA